MATAPTKDEVTEHELKLIGAIKTSKDKTRKGGNHRGLREVHERL